jgi:hypothetical protein
MRRVLLNTDRALVVVVPVTNLVARREAEAAIQAAGAAVNTLFSGIGSMLALELGGVYHG